MSWLASGLSWVDLRFLGQPHAIATAVASGVAGVALIDPGPTPCLPTLEASLEAQGIRLSDVTHILLTHIHLDHAAATGSIVQRHPRIQVVVHERGAPHLLDPSRLMASASRLYGERMYELWGDMVPVPAGNVLALKGGESISAGGRTFEVAYTPGHASHHVTYFERASGVAFAGDTAGVQIDGGYLLPPTPPPDIDLVAWRASVMRIEQWHPQTLFMTHFGPSPTPPQAHFQTLLDNLDRFAGWVKTSLEEPGDDDVRAVRFGEEVRREFRRTMPDSQVTAYELAAPFELLWLGLARYWRKK